MSVEKKAGPGGNSCKQCTFPSFGFGNNCMICEMPKTRSFRKLDMTSHHGLCHTSISYFPAIAVKVLRIDAMMIKAA